MEPSLFARSIAEEMDIPLWKVENTLKLLAEGATIPFIARYRKEAVGSLDELRIAEIQRWAKKMEELEKRRASILQSIEEQGKLTPELRARIEAARDMNSLEDLYLPYKRKRKTRASTAKEQGLEPLAKAIYEQRRGDVQTLAAGFLNEQVADVAAALQGARDIIAEWIHEDEATRQRLRRHFERGAMFRAKVARGKEVEGAKYRDYFDFEEPLKKCPSHRLLAILRGEEEGFLRVSIAPQDEEMALTDLARIHVRGQGAASDEVAAALRDSYQRLLAPGMETAFRAMAKEKADDEAIRVFSENLRQLLLAPPLGQYRIMGIDPGFRTGCKVVCLDESGNLLHHDVIYPHPPQSDLAGAREALPRLQRRFHIEAIAVGNGTAGRETLAFCRQLPFERPVQVFMVNEAGASIYSASEVAREEFPDQDITVRGAVSIARRLMDPLAELVKIDPKSIGVGQYQHDVNQVRLRESLDRTVEHCVNRVGVNLNTASKHLLAYVSGLGPALAGGIVAYRREHGPFAARDELKKVPRLGEKAFEQCAGFLRIPQARHPLDNTGVHPERYALVERMARDLGCSLQDLIRDDALRARIQLKRYIDKDVGAPTLEDILRELAKPGLDPRGQAKTFEFANVSGIDDIQEGMTLPGIVENITNFGVFIDIGIKESGLAHLSQLSDSFVKNPADVVSLGQEVMVRVVGVDRQRSRIQLSLKGLNP
jgi:uncharacterized protein